MDLSNFHTRQLFISQVLQLSEIDTYMKFNVKHIFLHDETIDKLNSENKNTAMKSSWAISCANME
jgi:hypothetical protein